VNDEDLAREALTIDSNRSTIVLILGMKGRGKSEAARMLFDGWPHDRVVIDPTGNARPDDPLTIPMTAPFPSQLPDPDAETDPPQTRVTVWARINPKSQTLTHDQDAAMGMALYPRRRRVLIWRDEFGLGVTANSMSPHDRAALMSSRHHHASLLLVVQRPRFIPTLAIAQADKILMFGLPNPRDREHIAENAGIPVPVLERQYHDNQRRHRHAFLLIDRDNDVLLNCPPLPGIEARGPAA
jgi:hypothetical protein